MTIPRLTLQRALGRGRNAKTRVFSVRLLGYLAGDGLWDANRSGNVVRPIWLAYLGTDQETQPFTANFRASRKALTSGNKAFEIQKKAPYRWRTQKVPGAVVTVAYLPELFDLEPASPFNDEIYFVLAW
jgi:hypothetical protein